MRARGFSVFEGGNRHGDGREQAPGDLGRARRARRVLEQIEDEKVEYVLFWFTDLEGHLKSFAITPGEIEGALDDGMGFDGSSITGFNAIEESDMVAIPDPDSFRLMPWREGETVVGRMICDVVTPDGTPYEGDPRYVLRRALERMESHGLRHVQRRPRARVLPLQGQHGHGDARRGRLLRDDGARRRDRAAQRDDPGARVDGHPDRVPPPRGRRRRSTRSTCATRGALDMADHTITYRLIVKEIAAKNGVYATFMPKPLFGENGSGMHTHMSLFKDGRNAVLRRRRRAPPVEPGKAFIAGLLRHAREMSAIFAQWVNSYKRLVPGYEAPVYVAWSQRNRSALIRIPLYKPGSEQATRAEIRCPDPACNPYLTFAALLHAGLEGIEQGYELPEPMETNLYHLTAEERRERGIVSLPETLGEAIDELAGSELMRQALGDAHLRPLRRAEAQGVGRVPRPAHAVGARPVPGGAL